MINFPSKKRKSKNKSARPNKNSKISNPISVKNSSPLKINKLKSYNFKKKSTNFRKRNIYWHIKQPK